jgi:hypothetical protein
MLTLGGAEIENLQGLGGLVSRRLWAVVPWILFALAVVSWVLALIFDQHSNEVTTTSDKIWGISFLAFPAVGTFLVSRIPRNPVGWLFLVGPLGVGLGVAMNEAGEASDLSGLILWAGLSFGLGLLALLSSILLFPDGATRGDGG